MFIMRLKSLIRIVLLLLCFSGGVSAQSPADSAALANASWRTVYDADGMTVRKLSIRLFDSDQQISCIEIAPEKYRLAVIQDSLRTKTSRIGKQSDAVAAINGGFFKTRTKQAVAMGFIKTGGYRPAQIGAETGVAVAVDTAGVLRLIDWSLAMEQADAPASGSVSRCDGNRPDAAARRPVVDSVGFDGLPAIRDPASGRKPTEPSC